MVVFNNYCECMACELFVKGTKIVLIPKYLLYILRDKYPHCQDKNRQRDNEYWMGLFFAQ